MQWQELSLWLFIAFLTTLSQMLGLLLGPPFGLTFAAGTGILAEIARRGYNPRSLAAWWRLPGLLILANAAGIVLASVSGDRVDLTGFGYIYMAPVFSAGFAAITRYLGQLAGRRCGLCSRPLRTGPAFGCPRCNLVVCEQHCWSFEALRCKLCLANEVPVFAVDGRWWDRQFGPRFPQGRCQLCMEGAETADLRACRRCGRTQCRHCWDMSNGQCIRCHWVVEDLTPSLSGLLRAEPGGDSELRTNE